MAEDLKPVWTTAQPLESMANLFLFPSEAYGEKMIELTVLKHEYGTREKLTVPLAGLLAVCESEGCETYWGVETYENGLLCGALFFRNRRGGYDHVLKIECNPTEVIGGTGKLTARASLYVPTNNIHNLMAPIPDKEGKSRKIRYGRQNI